MIKRVLLFVFLFFNFPVFSQEKDIVDTLELANQYNYALELFENCNYFDCITEMKRLLCFDSGNRYSFEAHRIIAKCYKEGGFVNYAINHFALAESMANDSSLMLNARLEKIRCNMLRGTTSGLKKQILDIPGKYLSENEKKYWIGWIFLVEGKWDSSTVYFRLSTISNGLDTITANNAEQEYSVMLAKILSYLVPGLGQFYTKNYISGLLSLSWNILFGYISINALIEDRIFDGFMNIAFLWNRFYQGNVYNAEKFAIEKNNEIYNKTINYIENDYKGLKP